MVTIWAESGQGPIWGRAVGTTLWITSSWVLSCQCVGRGMDTPITPDLVLGSISKF